MKELSLFSGAGGGLLGTKLLGWSCIGYVEKDQYCQKIIQQRIADGFLDAAPIFGDIIRFVSEGYAQSYQGMVEVITAGFPCQPFSVAGKRKAQQDKRNMWPETIKCIRVVRPGFVLLENVPGLLTSGYFGTILGDLAESGYDAKWKVLSAAEMGAPHLRKRLWVVAHANDRRQDNEFRTRGDQSGFCSSQLANTNSFRFNQKRDSRQKAGSDGAFRNNWWSTEPPLGRMAYGVANRVDRIKALGNGQVPRVVQFVWELLNEF